MASILWVPVLFTAATFGLYTLSVNSPALPGSSMCSNCSVLKFPTNVQDLHMVTNVLHEYKRVNSSYVFALFVCAYLYKQTFAIPGSVFMNLLAGALYGVVRGFLLTCLLTACGATFCYLLSKKFGKQYIIRYFPDKVKYLQNMIDENMGSLFFFLLFLRLLPMSPNWFMNIASPIVNIPIHLFTPSVFIGLMPYNFICVQTGSVLSQITSLEDMFTLGTLLKLSGTAVVALLPGFLRKKYHTKQD